MKGTEGHSLQSVAISVAFFAVVVCSLAAHGDSLSGGPVNVGTSQASTQNSSGATSQSQSAAETDGTTQSGGSDRASSNSGFADSAHSAATVSGTPLAGPPLRTPVAATTKTYAGKTAVRSTSRGRGIGKSSAWMSSEINSFVKPQRRYVRKGSKRYLAAKSRRANKSWKVVNYNWSDRTKKTSYVKGNNLAR